MYPVVVWHPKVGVDVHPGKLYVYALSDGYSPAGSVQHGDIAHGQFFYLVEKDGLGRSPFPLNGAFLKLALGHLNPAFGYDRAGKVEEGRAVKVNNAVSVYYNIFAFETHYQRLQIAQLIMVKGHYWVVLPVRRAFDHSALLQMEGHSLQINGAGKETSGGHQHGLAAGLSCGYGFAKAAGI